MTYAERYSVGDHVEVEVPDCHDRDMKRWMPGEVVEVTDNYVKCKRRGNLFERMGMIQLGWQGDWFAATWGGIRHVVPEPRRIMSPSSPSLEQRAMRSAVAWYVEFMERERDGKGR